MWYPRPQQHVTHGSGSCSHHPRKDREQFAVARTTGPCNLNANATTTALSLEPCLGVEQRNGLQQRLANTLGFSVRLCWFEACWPEGTVR